MWDRFKNDEGGNVALMFGLMGLVLITGAGAAIDMHGASSQKAELQTFADAAALAAIGSGETDKQSLDQYAKDHVDQLNLDGWTLSTTTEFVDGRYQVNIAGSYDTVLMGIIGKNALPLEVSAEVVSDQAAAPIDIAFVLDRTGSMAGGNMASLKTAGENLVTFLEEKGGENVRMSVVPFANHVNVGMEHINAVWLNTTKHMTSELISNVRQVRDVIDESLCTYEDRDSFNDGIYVKTYQIQVCPDEAYGPYYESDDSYNKDFEWFGCVGSRLDPHNLNPRYDNKKIWGIMNKECGQQLLPLTNDFIAVKGKIQELTASGETYIPAGLMWGWRTLDPNLPFDEAAPFDSNRRRAIIMMTDGANTKHQVDGSHYGNSGATGEAFAGQLCDLIKQDNIHIYTVAYNFPTGDMDGKEMVRNCASNANSYFDAQTAAQLDAAFTRIGEHLTEDTIRLTQ